MKCIDKKDIFIPDSAETTKALNRTTHLAIGAHADDLEIFAYHGILECYGKTDKWFTGVTVTNGAGSPRSGKFSHVSDSEMVSIRREEQNKAAAFGKYAAQIQLGLNSSEVKKSQNQKLQEQLREILLVTKPQVIYTHNLADKHDTHVAIAMHVIKAVKEVKKELDLISFVGSEVWRDLDWMQDSDKVILPVSKNEDLALQLCSTFESQITGGKRYDLAAIARRQAHATFFDSHLTDKETAISFAMDYMPLIQNPNLTEVDLVSSHIQKFAEDVKSRIQKFSL